MLFRAIFFIAAVALLAPHEPNSGFGSRASADMAAACNDGACTVDPAMLEGMKEQVLAKLQRVKADIAQAQRERGG